jgi:hypothetical protein
VFVAGAFPRSPDGRDNSAERNSRRRTTVDNITVPAILVRILHPIGCVRLCVAPDALRCRAVTHRYPLCSDVAPVLLLGEGLAQFVLLLLWQVGRDDLEVILL